MERDYLKTPECLMKFASCDTSLLDTPDNLKNVVGADTYTPPYIPVEGNVEVVQPELVSVQTMLYK